MNNLEHAKSLLQNEGHTCVLCKDDIVYTSNLIGIAPMVGFIESGTDLNGFSAADKIVGKAAALLFIFAGVLEVYADVMSEQAVKVFMTYGVRCSYKKLTPNIMNRAGTGLCPMEQAVIDIDEPSDALDAVKNKLEQLRAGRPQGSLQNS